MYTEILTFHTLFFSKVVTRKLSNNSTLSGFSTIINFLAKENHNSIIVQNSFNTPEIAVQIQQWLDYAVLYVAHGSNDKHVIHHLLNELNNYLLTRSYLVDHNLTLADLVMFYFIHNLMVCKIKDIDFSQKYFRKDTSDINTMCILFEFQKSLSPIEKENYLNLSRWFDHLQQDDKIRQNLDLINFKSIYLHNWATGTHM